MFGKKKEKTTKAQPKIEAMGRTFQSAKAETEAETARGVVALHVDQVEGCEPTLWISAPRNTNSFFGAINESKMYTFKDLAQMEQFARTISEAIIAVRIKRAEQGKA